ncbi:MAG: NUDIX domain-containing protein [Pirellulales bacterium]|nr:NUDIX domain-containing protein [Pirellulales bacterium]
MSRQTSTPILQAATIPYRMKKGSPEFCLITSIGKGNWGFPKGLIDPGETPIETALKESDEEAGLSGEIKGKPLGRFIYEKWGTELEVTVYLMKVSEAAEEWEEMEYRKRAWCDEEKARSRLHRQEYQELLGMAIKRISKA